MKKQIKLTRGLSGVAGEYFVAAELSRRNYIATLTLKNTKGIDILASNVDATKSVAIQVKAGQGYGGNFLIDVRVEKYAKAKNLMYVFVRLKDEQSLPDYYIVPAKKVAAFAKKYNDAFLARGGKDNTRRQFRDSKKEFLNRWDLLDLD